MLFCKFASPLSVVLSWGWEDAASAMLELGSPSDREPHIRGQSLLVSHCLCAQAAEDYIAIAYIFQNTGVSVGGSLF